MLKILLLSTLLAVMAFTNNITAQVTAENKTGHKVRITIGWNPTDSTYTSTGWWYLNPADTLTLRTDCPSSDLMYYYAESLDKSIQWFTLEADDHNLFKLSEDCFFYENQKHQRNDYRDSTFLLFTPVEVTSGSTNKPHCHIILQ